MQSPIAVAALMELAKTRTREDEGQDLLEYGLLCALIALVAFAALGLVVGLLVMLPGHALGATGAGDVKLMAAIGAIVGPGMAVNAFLFTALTGGLLALGVAVLRGRLAATVAGTRALVTAPAE